MEDKPSLNKAIAEVLTRLGIACIIFVIIACAIFVLLWLTEFFYHHAVIFMIFCVLVFFAGAVSYVYATHLEKGQYGYVVDDIQTWWRKKNDVERVE